MQAILEAELLIGAVNNPPGRQYPVPEPLIGKGEIRNIDFEQGGELLHLFFNQVVLTTLFILVGDIDIAAGASRASRLLSEQVDPRRISVLQNYPPDSSD
jgi:hypothetical protein